MSQQGQTRVTPGSFSGAWGFGSFSNLILGLVPSLQHWPPLMVFLPGLYLQEVGVWAA